MLMHLIPFIFIFSASTSYLFFASNSQMGVSAYVMTNTVTQFKRFSRPAVVKGTMLKINTSLPSVIHADPDLIYVFAQNLVSNLKIVHSNRTGKNSLTIDNVQ